MGLWILEPRGAGHVPGTVTILEKEQEDNPIASGHEKHVKYDPSGKFILVPQPSDDPNDPLNWPLWKRDCILAVLCLNSVIATTLSPILAATSFGLISVFRVTFDKVALLTGYHLLGVGVGGLFFVPSARVWGKRHCYLIGSLLIIGTSVWGGFAGEAQGYTSFLWARILQGVGLAPFESLVNASVGDLFFVHERGKRMALTTVCLFGAAFFAPVIVGKMASTQGFQWSLYWIAILMGVFFPLLFFYAPETAFVRSSSLNMDFGDAEGIEHQEFSGQAIHHGHKSSTTDVVNLEPKHDHDNENGLKELQDAEAPRSSDLSSSPSLPKKTPYLQTLAPFNGRKTEESFIKLFLRPFPLFLHIGVLYSCLTQGVMIGWTVLLGIVLSALFSLPPDPFSEVEVGYLFSSAFIGAVLAFILSGLVADPLAKFLTRKNKGIYEPEFRIPLVLGLLVFGCMGLYGFGFTASDRAKYGWIGAEVFFGFLLAGVVFGAVTSALYLLDAHREIAIEAFTCVMMFKNIFSFALTFHGYTWIRVGGVKYIFICLGSVQIGICALSIFMYVFGKINRAFWAKHDILTLFRLR